MKNFAPIDHPDFKHLQLFFYLIPIIGFFPAMWTLYRHSQIPQHQEPAATLLTPINLASREQLKVSRLAVTLALSWLCAYFLLNLGAETSEFLTLRLLILNSLLTSSYFLVSIWLMIRLYARKPVRLPGFSRLAEQVVGKHLSKD